jgi:hypothetical protein
MSKMMIVKTNVPMPVDSDLEAVRNFIFGVFDGFTDQDKKAWKGFWRRLIKMEAGEIAQAEMAIPRNYRFHKKFMALINFAFDAWEPCRVNKTYKGQPVAKNITRFRKDVIVQAGFYEQTFDLNGNMKLEAQSISFANMDDAEFEQLYSSVADVILDKVLITYADRDELDEVMQKAIGFL